MAKKYKKIKYNFEVTYLNIADGVGTAIKNECVKSVVIDHDYDSYCMPMVFLGLKIDKALCDHMIQNCNDNLFIVSLKKFDELEDGAPEIVCWTKKFTYFMTNDINKNNDIDYPDGDDENTGDTYISISVGLLCLEHVNRNKKSTELMAQNVTIPDIIKIIMSPFDPLILENPTNTEKFTQFTMPAKDSVNTALKYLNDYRVFYDTPYRYYQDFNYTYLISSSGKAVQAPTDKYDSIIVTIKEITDVSSSDGGYIDNDSDQVYEVPVNNKDTQVFDNTIANKNKTSVKSITTTGTSTTILENQASYSTEKVSTTRLNNDNTGMAKNIEADANNSNLYVYFSKNDIDTEIFTINKKLSVKHIDRYQDYNGEYLIRRKREAYVREDETFLATIALNLSKIGTSSS